MSDISHEFHDTATAYADKTNSELMEKHRLFKMLNSPILNAIGSGIAKFALSLGLPVEGLIKKTIFEQFCGGETIQECESTVQKLHASKIGAVLDYSVEGKSTEVDFDRVKDEIIKTIARAKDDPAIPFSVFKVTGIAPLGTLERMSGKKRLDAKSQAKCERIHKRIEDICSYAYSIDQPVFIDAEDSWIQDAIDRVAVEMMERFNRERAIVFNTLQMYRTDRLDYLKNARREATANGYILAVKLVRGAYMEKERERAAEMGYASPIHADKAAVDADYDAAIEYCLRHHEDVAFVAATHNERSSEKLALLMKEMNVPADHPNVFFSQLYGMGDNISYALAKKGYNVSKYLPYGPVADTMPYLIRRAEENTATAGQVSRELDLIEEEIRRRKLD